MSSVLDIADYIMQSLGQMTAMKLQKLVYYSQAWSLVWDERPLFNENIEAWANGPVCPALFDVHRGHFNLPGDFVFGGNVANLCQESRDTIDAVLEVYGKYDGTQLSILTHKESPWKDARRGYHDFERCSNTISHQSMADYYTAVLSADR